MILTAVITEAEEGGFIALNPETGTTTQGESVEEAMRNLKRGNFTLLGRVSLAGYDASDGNHF